MSVHDRNQYCVIPLGMDVGLSVMINEGTSVHPLIQVVLCFTVTVASSSLYSMYKWNYEYFLLLVLRVSECS